MGNAFTPLALGQSVGLSLAAVLLASTALAQSAQQGAPVDLGELVLDGSYTISDELRDQIRATSGAADVIGSDTCLNPAVDGFICVHGCTRGRAHVAKRENFVLHP